MSQASQTASNVHQVGNQPSSVTSTALLAISPCSLDCCCSCAMACVSLTFQSNAPPDVPFSAACTCSLSSDGGCVAAEALAALASRILRIANRLSTDAELSPAVPSERGAEMTDCCCCCCRCCCCRPLDMPSALADVAPWQPETPSAARAASSSLAPEGDSAPACQGSQLTGRQAHHGAAARQ